VIRLVVQVWRGSPVIQRATELYVVFRALILDGLPFHHTGESQNIAGKIAVSARWSATGAGRPRDLCRRNLKLPSTWLPRVAAIVAWCKKVRDLLI